MDCALVSVTRNGAWREENIQSAASYSDQTPLVRQFCAVSRSSGSSSASCMP
jgi:hypothetical protein